MTIIVLIVGFVNDLMCKMSNFVLYIIFIC